MRDEVRETWIMGWSLRIHGYVCVWGSVRVCVRERVCVCSIWMVTELQRDG